MSSIAVVRTYVYNEWRTHVHTWFSDIKHISRYSVLIWNIESNSTLQKRLLLTLTFVLHPIPLFRFIASGSYAPSIFEGVSSPAGDINLTAILHIVKTDCCMRDMADVWAHDDCN